MSVISLIGNLKGSAKFQRTSKFKTKQLNAQGNFILLRVANLFLAKDYDNCLKYSSFNFACICNSPFFEANILRFKALTIHEIYKFNKKMSCK